MELQSLLSTMHLEEFKTHFNPTEYNPLKPWEIPLDSSCLTKVSYNPLTQSLGVKFTDGTTGSYLSVDYQDFWGLVTAPSVGRYFNMYIRNLHTWVPN